MEHTQLSWHERGQLWLRLGLRGALALGALALLVWAGLPLLSLLSPFVCALVFAWLLNPAVRWLQRKTNISRKAISMVLVILVFAVIGGVLFGLGWAAVAAAEIFICPLPTKICPAPTKLNSAPG